MTAHSRGPSNDRAAGLLEAAPYGPSTVDGKLFYRLLDGTTISCICIVNDYAEKVVAASRAATVEQATRAEEAPVAWRYRGRTKRQHEWNAWQAGTEKPPYEPDAYYQIEPLFTRAEAEKGGEAVDWRPKGAVPNTPVSAPAQPGAAVALLREARDELNQWASAYPEWGDASNDIITRIDAHLSSAPAGVQEPIGEMMENGVRWFDKNPHAYPVGTKFYAAASAKAGYVSVPVEPTILMFKAFHGGIYPQSDEEFRVFCARYNGLLAAAASEQRGGSDK